MIDLDKIHLFSGRMPDSSWLTPVQRPAQQESAVRKAEPRRLVKDFAPPGRKGYYIYAVAVVGHDDKVKIGMTTKWSSRRLAYANWNLSPGNAIIEERVFCITEEFVDLRKLENAILHSFEAERAFGVEWFFGTVDEAARHIDRFLCGCGLSYL